MRDLDVGAVRAFLAVVETGGFTRAAARLNRTQSAVSMQIRRLEESLGSRLFADRKQLTLTLAGERFLPHARKIVALNDEAMSSGDIHSISGRVTIGTPDDYAGSFLPSVLKKLATTHPRLEVNVECALSLDLIKAVDAGSLDLAIVTRPANLRRGTTVRQEKLVWVAASEEVARLRPLPLATFTKGCIFNARILDALENEGIPFRLAYQSISHASIFAAVSEGLAATVVARSSVPHGSPLLATGLPLPDIGVIDIAVYGPESVSAATKTVRDSVVAALSCEDEKQRAA